jgi:N-acetylglutamate synthase
MSDLTLEWRVEESCRNAWPALQEVLLDGWLLRFSEGLSRRANSANPLQPLVHANLLSCETLYRGHELPTIFRVSSLIDPSVDERLASAGYTCEGDSGVLYGSIDDIEIMPDPDMRLLLKPTQEWFGAMAALQNHSAEQANLYQRIVSQIVIPASFAALSADGEIVALAYGAIRNAFLCYESVVTDRRRRRQGFARRIIASLAGWAKKNGVQRVCLEVESSNAPARALYYSMGLKRQLYRYHYRREPRIQNN